MATPNRTERGGRNKAKTPKNGDRTIKEGHEFVFNNGTWTKVENKPHTRTGQGSRKPATTKAPQYQGPGGNPNRSGEGQVQQRKPPVAKPPKNGDTTIKEGHKFVFKNGNWVKAAKPTPKPAAKPSRTTPSQQTRTSTSNNTVSRASTGKPAPKPAGKVPSSNAGMKNQDKNFRGNPNRKDSIASTLRELRSMGSGRKANEANTSKPEDKSRYVASNGKPYAGPAFGNSKPSAAKKEDKKMTLAERIRKRRTGMA
jgi:hypothetical protein